MNLKKTQDQNLMTVTNQQTAIFAAGVPEAIALIASAARVHYADVLDAPIPDSVEYTFGKWIDELEKRASAGDETAASLLGLLIDAADTMTELIADDKKSLN